MRRESQKDLYEIQRMKKFLSVIAVFLVFSGGTLATAETGKKATSSATSVETGLATQLEPMYRAKKFKFKSKDISSLKLVGLIGSVDLIKGTKKSSTTVVELSSSQPFRAMEEVGEGGKAMVRISSAPSDILNWPNGNAAPIKVRVLGNPVAFETVWRKGRFRAHGWSQPLKLSWFEGEIRLLDSKGRVQIKNNSGQIHVEKHEGDIRIGSERASVWVVQSKGKVYLDNHSGENQLNEFDGEARLQSFSGDFLIADSKGKVHFELQQARLRTDKFDGRIEGKGFDSSLRLGFAGSADMKVRTEAGNVAIRAPKSSGANINIGSVEGFLSAPSSIRMIPTAYIKLGRGRLDGHVPGSVFVRSKTGTVTVR